jgi:hypothetical protein
MIAMKKRSRNEMKNVVLGLEGKINHSNHKNQINHSSDV